MSDESHIIDPVDVTSSMMVATSTTPDAHAENVRLGSKYKVDPFSIRDNPFFAKEAKRQELTAQALSNTHPATAKYLSDPNRAAVSQDEIERLKTLEDIISSGDDIQETGLIRSSYRKAITNYLRERGREVIEPEDPVGGIKLNPFAQAMAENAALAAGAEAGLTPEEMGLRQPKSNVVELPTSPKGFMETTFTGIASGKPVPFANAIPEAGLIIDLNGLAGKMKAGKMEVDDWVKLLEYDNEMRRGTDFGGKIATVLVNLPAFAGEILTTGGLYTKGAKAGQQGTLLAARRVLNKTVGEAVEKGIIGMAAKGVGFAAGVATQVSVGMPHQVAVQAMRRRLPQFAGMGADEQGELEQIIKDPNDGFAAAVGKAFTSQMIEVGSEYSGGLINAALNKVGLDALKTAVVTRWFKLHPTSGMSQFKNVLRKSGYHGVLAETGEEFVADAMNAIIPWMESPNINSMDYWEEKLAGLVGFSILPAAGLAMNLPSMIKYSREQAARAQQQVDFMRDLGAQASESQTRTRVPGFLGKLGDLAAKDGPVERVFAPRALWDQYWMSKNLDPRAMAIEVMGSAEAYDNSKQAGETGADLEISLGAYVEKIAPTEHNDAIAQTLRFNRADAPNAIEMQAAAVAIEKATQEAFTLNQDLAKLGDEQTALADELKTLQEQVSKAQQGETQRTARIKEISDQLMATAPEALNAILSGGQVPPELAATAQELQDLTAQGQATQQAQERIAAIGTRQQEIETQIADLREREAQTLQSSPEGAQEVNDFANEVFHQLMATKNTSETVARAQANMFARMAYIMANRAGMTLKEFNDRFPVDITDGKAQNRVGGATTMSQEEQQRDADYLAAVDAGDMKTAQRLVDEAAEAAGFITYKDYYHLGKRGIDELNRTQAFFITPDFDFTGTASYNKVEKTYPLYIHSGMRLFDITDPQDASQLPLSDSEKQLVESVKRWYSDEGEWNRLSDSEFDNLTEEQRDEHDNAYSSGDYSTVESFEEEIRALGYDGYYVRENGTRNIGVLNTSQVKSSEPVTRDSDGNVIPLSERFNTERTNILYQQRRDADYLVAVEAGDMETTQRLVNEAAKAAGYNYRVYRGVESDYVKGDGYVFKNARQTYFTGSKETAESYANFMGRNPDGVVYNAFLKLTNPWIPENINDATDWAYDAEKLMKEGYDGVVGLKDGKVQVAVAFNANQIKSADPVTRDANGNVIPLSERFDEKQNSILYQSAPSEDVLADAPTITLLDLVGRAVFPIIADLTSAGVMYTGIDSTQIAVPIYTQGGPKFPLLPENQQAGVAWASQGTHIANSKAKLAGQSVLGVVVAMSQEAHKSNATAISAILATVQAYVESGRMTNEQVVALDELIRVQGPIAEKKAMDEAQSDLAKAQSKLKKAKTEKDLNAANKAIAEAQAKVEDANPGDKSLANWPGFGNAQAASEFTDRNKTTFGQRLRLADVIALKEAQALGTPNVEAILNELRDKEYDNMEWGDSIMVIEFDKNDSLVRLGTDGTKEHMSYEWGIRGKVVGKLARPINYTLIWDDFFKERRAQHSMFMEAARKEAKRLKKDFLNLTDEEFKAIKKTLEEKQELKPALEGGDRRSFELAKPVQVITQEIADRVPQTPYTAIKSPKHAQLVNAFINGKWMSTDVAVNAGGLGPAAFLNALAADPNKVLLDEYTLQSIKKAKKESNLRIYQLGEPRDMPGVKKENTSKVFFGIKNGDPASAYGLDPAAYGFGPNEKMLTLVLNGERNAPGMLTAIVIKALEEGATSLDCYAVPSKKHPNGFLPDMYEDYGFEVVGTIPFSEEYHSATKLADMKKLWKDSGWDEALGYPPIVLMKWRGTDEQRKGLKERYIREGTASVLAAGNPSPNAAAATDIRHDVGTTNGQEGVRPDGGRVAGNEGPAVQPLEYPLKLASAVAELQGLQPVELQNLGILTAAQVEEAVRKAKEEAENQPVFPEITLNQNATPVGMTAKQIANWAAEHSIEEVRQKLKSFRLTPTQTMLEMLGAFPKYLKPVVDFVMAQRQKLVDGNITAREVAKAYFITLSSIGADAINVTTIAQKADEIGMEFNPDPMFLSKGKKGQDRMRPEELAAWWFSTDMGQRALNAIEKGEIDREAWEQGLAIRDAFGRNDAREKRTKSGSYVPGMLGEKRKKKNLNDILEITKLINSTKGNSKKLEKVLNGIQGVGNGKKGFVGHMLGMGDVATIDAVEMNVWLTGKGDTTRADEEMKKRVALAKKGGTKVSDFYERIRSRIAEIHKKTKGETGIPDEVAAHIIHHWIWDKAKGAETTHAGVYEAMRLYQNVDFRPGVLTEAAQKFKAGEISREEYNRLAAVELPLTPFKSVPKPATMGEVRTGLGEYKAGTRLKRDMAQAPENIPAQTLESRLDIPAYREKGVWVVTLHEDRGDKSKGSAASPIAYTSTAVLNNVTFKVHESAALNIAAGKPKGTIATMRGDYQPMTADKAQTMAEQAMRDGWVQVGMNPLRHSYFYDKADERPVVSAEQVIQIGGLVLAKNPVYGNTADYLFQRAFHGSPHKFEKFMLEHIGTGEGAQAYGWGLYFAGNREVAEYYRETISTTHRKASFLELTRNGLAKVFGSSREFTDEEVRQFSYTAFGDFGYGSYDGPGDAEWDDERALRRDARNLWTSNRTLRDIDEAKIREAIQSIRSSVNRGKLYEVEIPENDVLLDWDEVVPEETIQKIAERSVEIGLIDDVDEAVEMLTDEFDRNGRVLYQGLSEQLGGDRAASLFLNSIGIKGIRYLDAQSRSDKEGTHNFVIFDDAAVEMLNTFYQNKNKPRGEITFNPAKRGQGRREFTIRMLKRADSSTFMHEAAHFYLETFYDLANQQGAPQALVDDWQVIADWLDIKPGQVMTTEQHETFARGFEKYLMEGKAPAQEVRGFFARMRRWLIGIYKDITNLQVKLSDSIRGVFDRMVATETEIAAAEAREKVAPMFSEKPEGMTDEAWEGYRKSVEKASLAAREKLQSKLEKEMLDALSEQRAEETARVREQVTKDLAASREHVALALLRFGRTPDDKELNAPLAPFKLDKQSLLDLKVERNTLDQLRRLGVYRVKGGVSVEAAAELLGYGSGEEMVQELVSTQPFQQAVDEETNRRLGSLHPSLMHDAASVQREASEAVHNTHRTDIIEEEVRVLRSLMAKDEAAMRRVAKTAPTPLGEIAKRVLRSGQAGATAASVLLDNSKVTTDFYKMIALDAAQRQLEAMKLRDIRPSVYLAAARSAGAKASREAAAGNFLAALGQKESELLNHLLYRESRKIQKEAQKQQRYLQKMTEDAARERLGKANPSYREQVDGLLERFNLIPIPLTQVDRRTRFAAWITAQQQKGVTLDIDESVLDETFRKDYRELTSSELTALYEAVKQIDHLASLTNKLLTAQRERQLREVVEELVAQLTANTPQSPEVIGGRTDGDKIREGWDGFFVAHRKLASLLREMDGFVDMGPMFRAIMKPINAAAEAEAEAVEGATEQLQKLFSVFTKEERKDMSRKRLVRGATRNYNMSHEDRLCIALNWGNEDNRAKLVDGYTGLTEADVLQILDTLTEKDWQFVQSVWDYIDTFWPAIRDKEERVYGLAPEKVEASPVVTKYGMFEGGYYPIKSKGLRSEGREDAAIANEYARGALGRATTRRGHTKERQEQNGQPMLLEMGVLFNHVQQVIHDITHHEMLIDVNRIIGNRNVQAAIEQHYGSAKYKAILKALDAVAVGNTRGEDFTRPLSRLRAGASIAGLGFNLVTSMMQAFGLFNSIPRVGALNMAKAVTRWVGSPKDMESSVAWIYERSSMMRLRSKTQNRELNEMRNTVNPKWHNALTDSYFYLIQKGQMLADVPTWLAGYYKAMEAGMSEAEAIAVADQTVIDTQGGGMVKDLAEVQRGGPVMKLFTTFYSYFNALWNQNVETVKSTNFRSPGDMGRMLVDLLILNSFPVVMQYALLTALRGGNGDDEEWYKTLAKQQMSYLLGQLVFVREFGGIMEQRGYEGTAGTRFIPDMYKLYKEAMDGKMDRGLWVSINKVGGILFHYPSVQLQRTFEGMKSLWDGKTSNPAVLVAGPTKEQR